MTERIHDFLRRRREDGLDDGPCLVVDLDVVRDNYRAFAKALPDSRVFYAVKANPAPELLSLLVTLGSCFDTASVAEIEMVLAAALQPTASPTATPSRRNATSRAPLRSGSVSSRSTASPKWKKSLARHLVLACFVASSPTASAQSGRFRVSSVASRQWLSTCSSMR